jgi:hypothetical protein
VKLADIGRVRVHVQGLATTPFDDPAAVVRWLGAVQAQEFALARWSVAQRAAGGRASAVDAAISDGTILRTHVLRPTWHFVAREDLRWMLALTAGPVLTKMRPWDRQAGIDDALVRKALKAAGRLIARSGHATRAEVAGAFARAGVPRQPWLVGHLLMHGELQGVVCSGAPRGAQQTYALVDERAPAAAALSGDEALGALTLRYFRSHGPASARDFQWWSGLGAAQVRRGLEIAGPSLECIAAGERRLLAAPGAAPVRRQGGASAVQGHLLQSFDELIVAYTDTRDLADIKGLARSVDRTGLLARSIVVDGQMVARWRREGSGRTQRLVVEPFTRLTRPIEAAVRDAAARYAAFAELSGAVDVAPPRPPR